MTKEEQFSFYDNLLAWYHNELHRLGNARVIVGFTGGRDYEDKDYVGLLTAFFHVHSRRDSTLKYHVGDCPTGVDKFVRDYACRDGVKDLWQRQVHVAYWNQYGKSAGPIRNKAMIDTMTQENYKNPEQGRVVLLAFKGGKGTVDCIKHALNHNAHLIPQLGGSGRKNLIDIFYPDGKPSWVDSYFEQQLDLF
jgi:hypothetical protein